MKGKRVRIGVDPEPKPKKPRADKQSTAQMAKPEPAKHALAAKSDRPVQINAALGAAIRKLKGGRITLLAYASVLADKDERFAYMISYFNQLSKSEKLNVRMEDLCAAAGIPPGEFLGKVTQVAFEQNMDLSNLIAAISQPEVVEYTIQQAQTPEGHKDREFLMKHSGFLPQAKGTEIQILNQIAAQANAQESAASLPAHEDDIVELAEVTRGDDPVRRYDRK